MSMRMHVRGRLLHCGLVLTLAATLAGCGEGGEQTSVTDWAAPNADPANTRHVGGPIDASSVGQLKPAWAVPLKSFYAATPVIVDGVAYTEDLQSNVYAIDVESGKLLWSKDYNQSDTGPNGVNVADGRVYGVLPDYAFALDAQSGRELWRTKLSRLESELVVMTPGEHDGNVYVSTVPEVAGAIGTLWALDAQTGRRLWMWEEVPRGLWGHPEINAGGGLWHPPAFDEHGDMYIAIANPLPFPGTKEFPWGSSRPGPNKWNNSIVKLDADSGRFVWGTQALPHDIYDWDLECPVILATVDDRAVAITGGKMGFVYSFDADSGRLLWKRSVGIHNGHDDDNLLAMRGQFEKLRLNEKMYPGNWGGIETPMSSDGETVYVPVVNYPATYREMKFALPEREDPSGGRGEIVALDVATGRVKWDRKLPYSPYGATTVVNDLVFATTYDGTLWALRTDTGAVVWRSTLPAGTDAPVAVAGDTLVTAASLPFGERSQLLIVAYRLGR
jgi:outer membrane protein assembly factor BamB